MHVIFSLKGINEVVTIFTFIAYVGACEQPFVCQIVIPFLLKHVEYTARLVSQNSVPVLTVRLLFRGFLLPRTKKEMYI